MGRTSWWPVLHEDRGQWRLGRCVGLPPSAAAAALGRGGLGSGVPGRLLRLGAERPSSAGGRQSCAVLLQNRWDLGGGDADPGATRPNLLAWGFVRAAFLVGFPLWA